MLSLSPVKILIIVVVAIILLGPDKLPQVARQVGETWKAFRGFQRKVEDGVRDSLPDLPSTGDLARMARSPVEMLDRIARYDPESPDGEIPEQDEEFDPGFHEGPADDEGRPRRPDLNSGDPGLN